MKGTHSKHQQHLYSQHDSYHVRQPDSTLFEDSPQNTEGLEYDLIQRIKPQYQRHHDIHNNNALRQSEESGGGMIMTSDGGDVRRMDERDYDDEQEVHEEDMEREGESDIEYIIMNLYSKMKNLESKYVDLANFYKQELVKTSTNKKQSTQEDDLRQQQQLLQPSYGGAGQGYRLASATGVTPSKSFERSVEMNLDQSPGLGGRVSPGRLEIPSERDIIRDLLEEKKKLEDDMKQMIILKGGGSHSQNQNNYQQSPIGKSSPKSGGGRDGDFQQNSISQEQISALKQQLTEAIHDVLLNIDSTQKKELQVLTQKQNEMYSLSTRYNLPSNIRNESLGLWYDAKTKISQCMGEMKFQIQTKQKDIEYNLHQQSVNSKTRPKIRSRQQQQQERIVTDHSGGNNFSYNEKDLQMMKEDLKIYKRKLDQQQKQIINFRNSWNFKDVGLKEDQQKLVNLVKELQSSLNNVGGGVSDYKKDHLMFSGEKMSNHNMLSPFEKKIQNYQKSAEMRKQSLGEGHAARSGSRGRPGALPISNTGSNFYPHNNRDYQNPQILQQNYMNDNYDSNDQIDIRFLKSKLRNLEYTLEDVESKLNIKSQEKQQLDEMIEYMIADSNKLVKQTEQLLSKAAATQSTISPSSLEQQQKNLSTDEGGANYIYKGNSQAERSKSKGNIKDNNSYTPISPNSRQAESAGSNFYSGQRQSLQDKKIGDLQRNNDQLFMELRKSNEKYLNQRVENNKLKDEIQILQNALQESSSQLKKQQQLLLETSQNQQPQRQQIKKKSIATSQRVDSQIPLSNTSQSISGGGAGRQQSNNSIMLVKENEDLKKKLQELEKECFTLTYYQQELQRRKGGQASNQVSSDPYIRNLQQDSQEMKAKLEQLCLKVQRFMFAMKRLQRAVNNKDKDTQIYKSEFELNKKAVELFVKETKEGLENKSSQQNSYMTQQQQQQQQNSRQNNSSMMGGLPQQTGVNNSMMATWDKRDSRFGGAAGQDNLRVDEGVIAGGGAQQRNRSQAPGGHHNNFNSTYNQQQQQQQQQYPLYSATQRINNNLDSSNNSSIPPRKVGIRAKNQQFTQQQQVYQGFNDTSSLDNQQQQQQQDFQSQAQATPTQEFQFNKVLEEVKQMQEESQIQKQQIDELKLQNENLIADKNGSEVQLKTKTINIQKLTQQIKASSDTIARHELLINDYKDILQQFESNPNNLSKKQINKAKTDLLMRERELIHAQLNQDSSRAATSQQNMTQSQRDLLQDAKLQQQIFQNQIQGLREDLTSQIMDKEEQMERHFEELNSMIQDKEDEITRVKKLFVEKLKEIETSFVEISQDMIDSEQIQQEASRKIQSQSQNQQLQLSQFQNQKHDLEKSIEQVIGRYEDDQREEELNQLVQANEELLEQVSTAQKYIKDLEQQVKELTRNNEREEEFYNLKQQNEIQSEEIGDLKTQLDKQIAMLDEHKNIKRQMQAQQKDFQKSQENLKQKHQQEINMYEERLEEMGFALKQEQEQRVLFESDNKNKDKAFKQMKSEHKAIQGDNEKLNTQATELYSQIDTLKKECDYLESLKKAKNNEDGGSLSNSPDNSSLDLSQFNEAEEAQNIEQNPTSAAQSYLRLLKATKKELGILEKAHAKLENKIKEQKEYMAELKQESRESVEQVVNMETKIFDLTNENEKLINELNKMKGTFKVDEESLRQQIEEQFNDLLKFKDSEIETMTTRLAKVQATNQEVSAKNNRLEPLNQELAQENERLSNKLQSVEMELEMTRSNAERDLDQVIEQEKTKMFIEKQKSESDRAKKEYEYNQQLKAIEQEKLILAQKIDKKKEKINKFKNEKQEISKSGLLQETIKKGLEQKFKEIQAQLEQEKVARVEAEAEKQAQIEEQQNERELMRQEHEKQRQEMMNKYQKDLEKERNKQGNIQKTKQEREEELIQQHKEELEELEQKMQQEREHLQSNQLINEKQKLQQLQHQMEQQKQELIKKKEEEHNAYLQQIQKQRDLEAQQLYEQYENEKQELENIKKQELILVENKLKNAATLQNKQQNKQISLVAVLQKKAREALLQQIDAQKLEMDMQRLQALQEQEKLFIQQNQLIQQKEQERDQQLQVLEDKLILQKQKELGQKDHEKTLALKMQEKLRDDLLKQIEEEKIEHQQAQHRQQLELERLKEEQEELVKTMSHQQDQQTQDLLAKKEREIEDLNKKVKDNQQRYDKDIEHKNDVIKTMKEEFDEQIQDLTGTYETQVAQVEMQVQSQKEQSKKEKELMNQAKLKEIETLKNQHVHEIDLLNSQHQNDILHEQSIVIGLNQEIEKLKLQKEQLTINIQKLNHEKEEHLKKKEEELNLAKIEHQKLIQESEQTNQKELDQLKLKLQEDHTQLLKKKDQEKSLVEKMQERVRQELSEQLQDKEKEKLEKQKVIKSLEDEIAKREQDFETERVNQQELVDEMNKNMILMGQQKVTMEKEHEKMKAQFDTLKKQQLESEKELIRDLREKLASKEKQADELLSEKKDREQEIAKLKATIKEKETEINNLEKDLDQFVKDNEEEKQGNDETIEQINNQLKDLQKQKDSLTKEKKEGDLQMKMKEALLKQLQEKLEENQTTLLEKDNELQQIQDMKSQSQKTLDKQIKDLQKKHHEELQRLEEEKQQIQDQVNQLLTQKNIDTDNLNQSLDEIQQKLGQFEVELSKVKNLNKQLEKQKNLNDSLLNSIHQDNEEEIIGDVVSNKDLQFCKRIKYLDKAWILVCKNDKYIWIDQDKIPLQNLQRIQVEQMEETSGKLKEKLDELTIEKERLVKLMQQQDSSRSEKLRGDSQRVIVLDNENQSLKQELNEINVANNQLQQDNLKLKQTIKELNDMVFGLSDTEKNHDSVKKVYEFQLKNQELTSKLLEFQSKNQELTTKLVEQYQNNKELEQELDKLRNQSFIGNGKNGNSVMKPDFQELDASSILHQNEEDDESNQFQVRRLETELEEFQKIKIELEMKNRSLQDVIQDLKSKSSGQSQSEQQQSEKEMHDQLKHIRGILVRFLERTPITIKENEDLLPIVYSMMLFTKEEINKVQQSRTLAAEKIVVAQTKKGVFGGMFKQGK